MNKIGAKLFPSRTAEDKSPKSSKKALIPDAKEKMATTAPEQSTKKIMPSTYQEASSSKVQIVYKEKKVQKTKEKEELPESSRTVSDKRDRQLLILKGTKDILGYKGKVVSSQEEARSFFQKSSTLPGSYCVWKSSSNPKKFSIEIKLPDGTTLKKGVFSKTQTVLTKEISRLIFKEYLPKAPIEEQFIYLDKIKKVASNKKDAQKALRLSINAGDYKVWKSSKGQYQLMIRLRDHGVYQMEISPNDSIIEKITSLLESKSEDTHKMAALASLEKLQLIRKELLEKLEETSNKKEKTKLHHELNINALQHLSLVRNYWKCSGQDLHIALQIAKLEYLQSYEKHDPLQIDNHQLNIAKKLVKILEKNDYFINHITTNFNPNHLEITEDIIVKKFNLLQEYLKEIKLLENDTIFLREFFELSPMPQNAVELEEILVTGVREATFMHKSEEKTVEGEDTLVIITHPGDTIMSFQGVQDFPSGGHVRVFDEVLLKADKKNPTGERVYERILIYEPPVKESRREEEGEVLKEQRYEYTQIHYENWPKKGTPNPEVFSAFVEAAKGARPDKHAPPLIICTPEKNRLAGPLIESLNLRHQIIQEIHHEKDLENIELDIDEEVLELRLQNPNLISTKEDLGTIYLYLQNLHESMTKAQNLRGKESKESKKVAIAEEATEVFPAKKEEKLTTKTVPTKTTSDHKKARKKKG